MITIKPHHFIDIVTAVGQGQAVFEPHPYGHAVHTVAAAVLADLDTVLCLELGADDICRPCSHCIDGICDDRIDTSYRPQAPSLKREWNLLIDRRWCERLGVVPGERLTARSFCRRLRERAGEITDIYREIPADRTAQRQARLAAGVAILLGEDVGGAAGR